MGIWVSDLLWIWDLELRLVVELSGVEEDEEGVGTQGFDGGDVAWIHSASLEGEPWWKMELGFEFWGRK